MLVAVVLLWLSVGAMLAITWSFAPLAGVMILPDVLRPSFAAILDAKIVPLHRPFG